MVRRPEYLSRSTGVLKRLLGGAARRVVAEDVTTTRRVLTAVTGAKRRTRP